jgi:hypothetical protein
MRENVLEDPKTGEPQGGELTAGELTMGKLSSTEPANLIESAQRRTRALREGPDLEKRYPLALALYALLAALVWFTMDPGKVEVFGKPVELRLVPLIIIGGLALRTMLARQADRIRRAGEKGGS